MCGQKSFDEDINRVLDSLGITQEEGFPSRLDQKGRAYVTLTIGGRKEEGSPLPMLINTASPNYPDLIRQEFIRYLLKELDGDKHIVWRARPSLLIQTFETNVWRKIFGAVRSRLSHYQDKAHFDSLPDVDPNP